MTRAINQSEAEPAAAPSAGVTRLFDAVDRMAAAAPGASAYRVPGDGLTWSQLADRTHRLARHLVAEGVRPGECVGVFMPRCLDTPVAVHGITRAGAAFVPIDPHLPEPALRRLLDTCRIRHLVSHRDQRRTLAALAAAPGGAAPLESVTGIDLDLGPGVRTTAWSVLDAMDPGPAPDPGVGENDLAYVMFSSGSTGRPKGIMHTHRSGLAYARLSAATYDLGPSDVIANHSPLHFDMSTLGYLTAPYAGAATVIVPEAYTKLTASLSQLIADEGVTVWYSVPLALIQLLERGALEARDCSAVRWVLYGGEPFPAGRLRNLMRAWPGARVSNVYGPAEVNQCTFFHLPAAGDPELESMDTIPIGAIWAESHGLVVDSDDAPVAAGETGELVVATPTMMLGYWERPDLDARAFLRRTGADGAERTYYRTGDHVRTDAAGRLEFVGRRDRQVKIRGHRVELDDVEAALAAEPGVAEAAVFPVRASEVAQRIEAAVTLTAGAERDAAALVAGVAARLPAYAVPARITVRGTLPRTGTDKIDRRRLRLEAEAAVVAAEADTTTEEPSA